MSEHERHIPFERVLNFRDLGGYRAADGRAVRWRRLFRSDAPGNMSEADERKAREELSIVTVIDLREPAIVERGGVASFVEPESLHHIPLLNDAEVRDYADRRRNVASTDWYLAILRSAGMDAPIYPIKGYSMTYPVAGAEGAPTMGGIDEEALIAWSRLGDRVRFTATAEFSGYDTSHRPSDFIHMKRVARELFPDSGDFDQATYWACLRPMTPDGPPILGRGRLDNLWLNTGQGHMGWTMACGSGAVVADLINGCAPAIDIRRMAVR